MLKASIHGAAVYTLSADPYALFAQNNDGLLQLNGFCRRLVELRHKASSVDPSSRVSTALSLPVSADQSNGSMREVGRFTDTESPKENSVKRGSQSAVDFDLDLHRGKCLIP